MNASRFSILNAQRFFFLFLFYGIPFSLIAQNVTINGYAPAYKSQDITLYIYADYISYAQIPVATETVSDSGFFKFVLQTDDVKRILLKSSKQKANMYIEPDRNYTVFFPGRDTVHFLNPNVEQNVDLEFAVTDTTEINALIISYNEHFEKFWTENYQYFVLKKSRERLDSFRLQMQNTYAYLNKPYFKSYITYNIADLDLSTFQGKNGLSKKYIVGKPVLYDHYEYMNFFNNFFNHYLQLYAQSKNGNAMTEQINGKAGYQGCMSVLAGDKYLKNDTLRELVLIKGLSELYYVPDFSRENILNILEQIASNSKIALHQVIAANVINSFSKLRPGESAPAFTLLDQKGKKVNLTDFKGKFVYLDFWATWCIPCLQEMKLIPSLKKKYGDKIVFISISLDDDTLQMKKFLAKNPKWDWVILHYGSSKQVKEDYEIKSVPSYFLINPFGNFTQSPALRPTQDIESTFWGICFRKKLPLK
jgi:thiol-disulfide isomerase/thioredoxin